MSERQTNLPLYQDGEEGLDFRRISVTCGPTDEMLWQAFRNGIQELFVELINKRENLGDTQSIKFYLFKSLRRKLVRMLRKNSGISMKGI